MYSPIISIVLINLLINLTIAIPVFERKTSSIYSKDINSPDQQPTAANPDTSETVQKILRLMQSLSNRNILISSSPVNSLSASNFNLNEVKREDNLKFKTSINEPIFRLKSKKFNENDRFVHNERFNDNFNDYSSNDNLNDNLVQLNDKLTEKLNEKLTEKLTEKLNEKLTEKLINKFDKLKDNDQVISAVAKYPPVTFEQIQKAYSDFTRSNYPENKFMESFKQTDSAPVIANILDKINQEIEEDNREEHGKLTEKAELAELEELERYEPSNKNLKKNLIDMVENEEEDNQGEEEHFHNYNISLFSDAELNRTLIDILWLLDQNLNFNKEEMERKFGNKGRNNRNKIASRFEYYDKLYRNLHHLPLLTNTQKRGEGPQLSVVSPLDILRDKLMLEMARRKIEQSKYQLKENEELLKKMG